ncbi:MAG: hypothetical protein JXB38_05440, partial [Anaerolineales bacterium]|nr:hypothetical protein [Anaerolineales bacterium]
IALDQTNGCVVLRIQDNGRGFDLAAVSPTSAPESRLGLLGIQERAELVGGCVTFSSSPGKGTCLEVQIPLKPEVESYAG